MKRILLLSLFAALAFSFNARAHEEIAANEMAAAANNLIASLTAGQKAAAVFAFDHDHRHDWHFVPMDRKGIPLKDMTTGQRFLTSALLASGLSSQGFVKANTIMSLEEVLQVIEGPNRRRMRDPELYCLSIFGEPGPGKTWGWRFEGHHISLSFTVANGQHISATPSFLGSNPGIVPSGPRAGLQVLADEENIGRELARSLSAGQRGKAVIAERAPSDIITSDKRKISPLDPQGISWTDLSASQREMLWQLVNAYVRRARGEIADVDLKKITDAGQEKLHFAWAGGTEPGEGHYYRIQGPTFLIEFDNTQGRANHAHSVYRDFTEDFGEDLLKRHYEQSHR